MRTFVVISCLVAVVVAQFPPAQPGLKEAQHFQAINQPHLPKDTNVLHATQQFLTKFAELKALADAAPDPVPAGQPQTSAPQQTFAPAAHRFAPQPAARAPTPRGPPPPHAAHAEFDVNAQIGALLAKHHAANPTPAPTVAPRRQVPQAARQQHSAFPTFNVLSNFGGQRQQAQPTFRQAAVQQVAPTPNIVTHNEQGQLINPKRFPGPLAHTVPAGVGGVGHTQFTPEVAAAHRALAQAHANILKQQAALPRPVQ